MQPPRGRPSPLDDGVTETLPNERLGRSGVEGAKNGARFAPGTLVAGRYRVVALLGRGGMGEVYRAEDLRLGDTVALKFLPPELAADRDALARLVAEVRAGRRVAHPNVCRVHDLVEDEGRAFVSMEYVDGEDLASLLARIDRLPPGKALELLRDVCRGLLAIHQQGIVHRDLKPQNVMVDGRGRARITDFGLAVVASEESTAGSLAGTLLYMAPEQLRGAEASFRTDLYALGLVAYEMLTGRRPHPATTFDELVRRRATPPPALAEVAGQLAPGVEELVLRCLAEGPEARPASAREVLLGLPGGDALEAALLAGETPSPDQVAAVSAIGQLAPVPGWGLLLAFVAGLWLMAGLADRSQLHRRLGLPRPPEALAARAEDLLAAAGLSVPKGERAGGFFYPPGMRLRHAEAEGRVPPPIRYFFRASPERLDPWRARFDNLFLVGSSRLGRVTLDDPPLVAPGEVAVVLDPTGRLVELLRRPPTSSDEARPASDGEVPWLDLLAATGVEGLEESAPGRAPPVGADTRKAWRGRHPAGAPVVVEAAAFAGQPVWLAVGPAAPPAGSATSLGDAGWVATLVAASMTVFLVGAIALVRRHLRLRRGDRTGAFRLAIATFAVLTVAGLLRVRHQGDVEAELLLLGTLLSQTVFCTFLVWMTYLAIEPYVRRHWPLNLVSWTRLLAGRWADPMVGRDVLLGGLAGVLASALQPAAALLEEHLGSVSRAAFVVSPSCLSSLRDVVYFLLYLPYPAILNALGFLLFLVLLRATFRRTGPALLTLWLLIVGPVLAGIDGPLASWSTAAAALGAALLVLVVWRLGLLATAAALWVWFLLSIVPLTLDPDAWEVGRSLAVLGLLAAVAAASFYAAVGGRLGFGALAEDLDG